MLDLSSVHALARRRSARLAVEAVLRDGAAVAREEGLAGSVDLVDRLEVLTRWHHGDVDAAVVDQRPPEEGAYGWFMLMGASTLRQGGGDAATFVLVSEQRTLAEAARLLARLAVEPRAVALLDGDEAAARQAGLAVKPLVEGEPIPAHATLAYAGDANQVAVVERLLYRGAHPVAMVRLDAERPLLAATGDPVEAMALAGALAP